MGMIQSLTKFMK